jgi:hypothetical protein
MVDAEKPNTAVAQEAMTIYDSEQAALIGTAS